MTMMSLPLFEERKPAPWLVAAGIVAAITVALSCLVILAV